VQHIAEADFIFRSTDLNFDAVAENIGFQISQDITVYTTSSPDYRFRDTSLDSVELMNKFSSYNFDRFCLAIAFTYRELGSFLSRLRLSCSRVRLFLLIFRWFLGHLLRDDLINPVKMSLCEYLRPSIRTSTVKHSANQIVVFVKVDDLIHDDMTFKVI